MTRTFLLCFFIMLSSKLSAQHSAESPEIGIVNDLSKDSLLSSIGYQCLVESTNDLLSPRNVPDKQFEVLLNNVKELQINLFACNLFIPANLKVVGPDVDEKALLQYVDIVLKRAKAAGLEMIIWGSGGSRRIPEGFDRDRAKQQFISIAKKIGDVAARYDIILAIENLNRTEVNFLNTVSEAHEIIKAVDHKNIRLCADVYHMLKEDESPEAIIAAKDFIVYCEVAEEEGRTAPGVHGEDFTPYFSALHKIGYKGKIVMECRWSDLTTQAPEAFKYLKQQIAAGFK